MANRFDFKQFFLAGAVVPSRSDFKRLMLTGYLSLICIVVAMLYTFVDLSYQVYYAFPVYGILVSVPLFCIWLIRNRHYKTAKVVLMLTTNLVAFWTVLNDPIETGPYLFFIPVGLGSFAILGFEDVKTGLALASLTAILFLIAFLGDFHITGMPRPSDEYIRISFIINFFISLTISILGVYFLMQLNKLSEEELILNENLANQRNIELQKVNEELDRFVYSVSHDLRSPLSSILGLINLARLTDDRGELDQILKMIQGRVNSQDHFIREIIDYARNARTETVTERVHVRSLVNEVIDSLKFNVDASKIDFRIGIPDDVVLHSDRIRLTIILSNLVGNAIKYHDFTKENPFIAIGYRRDIHAIYVEDNGMGMLPEHQEKIFNMFYRGSDRSTGSGLGLYITREAVTKLNGSIEVSSIFGEGSTFLVSLSNSVH